EAHRGVQRPRHSVVCAHLEKALPRSAAARRFEQGRHEAPPQTRTARGRLERDRLNIALFPCEEHPAVTTHTARFVEQREVEAMIGSELVSHEFTAPRLRTKHCLLDFPDRIKIVDAGRSQ